MYAHFNDFTRARTQKNAIHGCSTAQTAEETLRQQQRQHYSKNGLKRSGTILRGNETWLLS